jgi:hypothetical protein
LSTRLRRFRRCFCSKLANSILDLHQAAPEGNQQPFSGFTSTIKRLWSAPDRDQGSDTNLWCPGEPATSNLRIQAECLDKEGQEIGRTKGIGI